MLKQYLDIYIIRPNMETRNFVRPKQFGYSQRQKLVKKKQKNKKKKQKPKFGKSTKLVNRSHMISGGFLLSTWDSQEKSSNLIK